MYYLKKQHCRKNCLYWNTKNWNKFYIPTKSSDPEVKRDKDDILMSSVRSPVKIVTAACKELGTRSKIKSENKNCHSN